MPYSIQVIRAGDFMRLGASGKVDFAGSRRILAELAASMVQRKLDRALLDVRKAEDSLTTNEVFKLAETFHEAGFRPEDRLAILHRANKIAKADFFAMCANQRGWTVGSFDTFEDAFDWLTTPPPEPPWPGGLGGVPTPPSETPL